MKPQGGKKCVTNKEKKKLIDYYIAMQIKERRTQLGTSMQEMGDYLGVQKSTYHYYESGKTSMDIYTIITICDYLKLNWSQVIEEANRKASDDK